METYESSIDDTGRIVIPAQLRSKIPLPSHVVIECYPWWPLVKLWVEDKAVSLAKALIDIFGADHRSLRHLVGGCIGAPPDGKGRLHIPAGFRQHARLELAIVILAKKDHLEIWDKFAWLDRYHVSSANALSFKEQPCTRERPRITERLAPFVSSFMGTYKRTIDEFGRISIPAVHRRWLAREVIVTCGCQLHRHIDVYGRHQWSYAMRGSGTFATVKHGLPQLTRPPLAPAFEDVLDAWGRMSLPQPLCDFAKLEGPVLVVADGDHVGLWNEELLRVLEREWYDKMKAARMRV